MCLKAKHCYMAPESKNWRGNRWGTSHFPWYICQGSFSPFLIFCLFPATRSQPQLLKLIPSQSHIVFKCVQREKVGLEKKKIHTCTTGSFWVGAVCPFLTSAALPEANNHFHAAKWASPAYCRQVEWIKQLNFWNIKVMPIKILLPFFWATAENWIFSDPL